MAMAAKFVVQAQAVPPMIPQHVVRTTLDTTMTGTAVPVTPTAVKPQKMRRVILVNKVGTQTFLISPPSTNPAIQPNIQPQPATTAPGGPIIFQAVGNGGLPLQTNAASRPVFMKTIVPTAQRETPLAERTPIVIQPVADTAVTNVVQTPTGNTEPKTSSNINPIIIQPCLSGKVSSISAMPTGSSGTVSASVPMIIQPSAVTVKTISPETNLSSISSIIPTHLNTIQPVIQQSKVIGRPVMITSSAPQVSMASTSVIPQISMPSLSVGDPLLRPLFVQQQGPGGPIIISSYQRTGLPQITPAQTHLSPGQVVPTDPTPIIIRAAYNPQTSVSPVQSNSHYTLQLPSGACFRTQSTLTVNSQTSSLTTPSTTSSSCVTTSSTTPSSCVLSTSHTNTKSSPDGISSSQPFILPQLQQGNFHSNSTQNIPDSESVSSTQSQQEEEEGIFDMGLKIESVSSMAPEDWDNIDREGDAEQETLKITSVFSLADVEDTYSGGQSYIELHIETSQADSDYESNPQTTETVSSSEFDSIYQEHIPYSDNHGEFIASEHDLQTNGHFQEYLYQPYQPNTGEHHENNLYGLEAERKLTFDEEIKRLLTENVDGENSATNIDIYKQCLGTEDSLGNQHQQTEDALDQELKKIMSDMSMPDSLIRYDHEQKCSKMILQKGGNVKTHKIGPASLKHAIQVSRYFPWKMDHTQSIQRCSVLTPKLEPENDLIHSSSSSEPKCDCGLWWTDIKQKHQGIEEHVHHDHNYASYIDPSLDISTDSAASDECWWLSQDAWGGINITGQTVLDVETVTMETILADPTLKNVLWRPVRRPQKVKANARQNEQMAGKSPAVYLNGKLSAESALSNTTANTQINKKVLKPSAKGVSRWKAQKKEHTHVATIKWSRKSPPSEGPSWLGQEGPVHTESKPKDSTSSGCDTPEWTVEQSLANGSSIESTSSPGWVLSKDDAYMFESKTPSVVSGENGTDSVNDQDTNLISLPETPTTTDAESVDQHEPPAEAPKLITRLVLKRESNEEWTIRNTDSSLKGPVPSCNPHEGPPIKRRRNLPKKRQQGRAKVPYECQQQITETQSSDQTGSSFALDSDTTIDTCDTLVQQEESSSVITQNKETETQCKDTSYPNLRKVLLEAAEVDVTGKTQKAETSSSYSNKSTNLSTIIISSPEGGSNEENIVSEVNLTQPIISDSQCPVNVLNASGDTIEQLGIDDDIVGENYKLIDNLNKMLPFINGKDNETNKDSEEMIVSKVSENIHGSSATAEGTLQELPAISIMNDNVPITNLTCVSQEHSKPCESPIPEAKSQKPLSRIEQLRAKLKEQEVALTLVRLQREESKKVLDTIDLL